MNYTSLPDLTEQLRKDQGARASLDYIRSVALRQQFTADTPAHMRVKSAVTAALQSANPDLKAPFVDLIALVEQGTLLGRLQGVPAPPFVPVLDLPSEPVGGWVGDSGWIPAASLTLNSSKRTALGKLGGIYAVAVELLRASDGRARQLFDRAFVNLLRRLEDRELLSTTAAVAGQRPAGLLATAPEFSSGSPGGLETDIAEMFAYVSDGQPVRPSFVASPRGALWLALQKTDSGARFPNARVDGGGDIAGVPLLVSAAAGNKLILVDAGKLVVTDQGLDVEASEAAALELDDLPTAGPANVVSAWQTNTAFIRVLRYLHWVLASDDASAFTTLAALAGSPA